MTVMTSTLPRRRGRFMLALPVLTLLLCVLAVVHLGVGARTISPQTVVQALFHFDAKNFDHRIIVSLRLLRMTAAMLVGAALLLLADIAARTVLAPQELATGIMTALVGAPAFIFIASRFLK